MRAPRLPLAERPPPSAANRGSDRQESGKGSRGLHLRKEPPLLYPTIAGPYTFADTKALAEGSGSFHSRREAAAPLVHPTVNTAATGKRWKEKTTKGVQTEKRQAGETRHRTFTTITGQGGLLMQTRLLKKRHRTSNGLNLTQGRERFKLEVVNWS